MTRQKMTMRCTLSRNSAPKDPYGTKGAAMWKTIDGNLPCCVWETGDRKVYGTAIVEAGSPMMVTKKSADVTIDDHIADVIDRAGTVLYSVLSVESVILRKDHKEVRLKKVV